MKARVIAILSKMGKIAVGAILLILICVASILATFLFMKAIDAIARMIEPLHISAEACFIGFATLYLLSLALNQERKQKNKEKKTIVFKPNEKERRAAEQKSRPEENDPIDGIEFETLVEEWLYVSGLWPDRELGEKSTWDFRFRTRAFPLAFKQDRKRAIELLFGFDFARVKKVFPEIVQALLALPKTSEEEEILDAVKEIERDPSIYAVLAEEKVAQGE